MFDLMIPTMINATYGNSVITFGVGHESCHIHLADGMGVLDLIRMWHEEAKAISCHKRKRGVLPTEIGRDVEGRLGCISGWVLVRDNEHVHIYDCAHIMLPESPETFEASPQNWWRCIKSSRLKNDVGIIAVPISWLAQWSDRLFTLLNSLDATTDLMEFNQETMRRNFRVLSAALGNVAGGKELVSMFPPDCMRHMVVFLKSGRKGRVLQLASDASRFEFERKLSQDRGVGEFACWTRQQFRRGGIVAFLDARGKGRRNVAVFTLKPCDNLAKVLPALLSGSHLGNEIVDCIALGIRCDLSVLERCNGWTTLSASQFRHFLKNAFCVLLGVCKGTAWVQFPLGSHSL